MSYVAESGHHRRRGSSAVVIAMVTAAMLVGCGHSGGGSSSPDGGASSSAPVQPAAMPHECAKTGPVVFAVSGRADSPAPTLTTSMQTAATMAVDDGSPIGIVDVDGDPALIEAGAFSDKGANPIALANDQQAYLSSLAAAIQATRATHPDVDVLDALEVAGRALHAACNYGGTIYLEDSGLQETGAVNFRQGMLGAAPGDVVSFLAKEGELPELRGLNMVLVGIGDTAPPQQPLSIGQRDNLIAIWTAIAKAGGAVSVSVDPSPRNGVSAPEHVPPVQLVPVPALQAWAPSDHTYVFPDEGPVGFLPNLAKFRDPAAAIAALRGLGTYLAANPSVRIKLTGTTARVPPLSGCIGLSLQRAEAVRRVLLTYGAHLDQISIAGVGWEFPGYENDQGPGGILLPGPAEHNRSVIVTAL
jgi:OmpA-OmpF porin, OOP family